MQAYLSITPMLERIFNYAKKNKVYIAKFAGIGLSLYFLSRYLLDYYVHVELLPYWHANLYQSFITYPMQFLLNSIFTWADRKVGVIENLIRISKFIPIKIVVMLIHQVIFNTFIFFDTPHQWANALTVGIIVGGNFLVFDLYIFAKNRR